MASKIKYWREKKSENFGLQDDENERSCCYLKAGIRKLGWIVLVLASKFASDAAIRLFVSSQCDLLLMLVTSPVLLALAMLFLPSKTLVIRDN